MNLLVTFFFATCAVILGVKVIPERGNVTFANPKYIEWAYYRVQRFSRRSDYFVHMGVSSKHPWGNNMTLDVRFLEYLHNEFRPSFIGGRMKLCELIYDEPYIGGIAKAAGIPCPAPAGEYVLNNVSVPSANFPNVFPFEKGRVDISALVTDTSEMVLKFYLVASFIQKKPPIRRKAEKKGLIGENKGVQ